MAKDSLSIGYEELLKMLEEGKLNGDPFQQGNSSNAHIYAADGKIFIHTGIVGDCDIAIELHSFSASKFYPGG